MRTYAESVWQHSPGLPDCVGQPWERVSLHSANSERVEQGVGRNAGINPDAFHATSGIDLLTEHPSGFLASIWGQLPRVARLCRATLGCAAKPLRGKANVLLRRLLNVSRAFGVERNLCVPETLTNSDRQTARLARISTINGSTPLGPERCRFLSLARPGRPSGRPGHPNSTIYW